MNWKTYLMYGTGIFLIVGSFVMITYYSEESQNKVKRYFEAGYGFTHGRVDVGTNPPTRFLQVEKLTTATAKDDPTIARDYRYGYGYFDLNMNGIVDLNEKEMGKLYFDVNNFTSVLVRNMGKTEFEQEPK